MSDATLVERSGEFAVVSDFIASPLQQPNFMLSMDSYRFHSNTKPVHSPTVNGVHSADENSSRTFSRGRGGRVHPRFIVGENNNESKYDVI